MELLFLVLGFLFKAAAGASLQLACPASNPHASTNPFPIMIGSVRTPEVIQEPNYESPSRRKVFVFSDSTSHF